MAGCALPVVLLLVVLPVTHGNVLLEKFGSVLTGQVKIRTVRDIPGLTDTMVAEAVLESRREQAIDDKKRSVPSEARGCPHLQYSPHYKRFVPELEPERIHAMVMEKTTRKLADKLRLPITRAARALRGLSTRDLRPAHTFYRFHFGETACDPTFSYRSTDGTCNNLYLPHLGASYTGFSRVLLPEYGDGVSTPRAADDGGLLPNARMLSMELFRDVDDASPRMSHMAMIWGQFIDHDITHAASQELACNETCGLKGECYGIPIPEGDKVFRGRNVSCIRVIRNSPIAGGLISPREQTNTKSSYMDASQVYGDSMAVFDLMRVTEKGLLLERAHPAGAAYKNLLPKNDKAFCRTTDKLNMPCFLSGDLRVNENPGLASMHTIWSHEHNRLVSELRKLNPHWNTTRLFYETRKIVGAMMQHITYNEFLPLVLDNQTMRAFLLRPNTGNRYYYGYSPAIDGSIFNSFSSGVYRFGHSLVRNLLNRFLQNSSVAVDPPIYMKRLFDPTSVYNVTRGGVDSILRGLARDPAQKIDGFFAKAIQEELTRFHGDLSDLPAINIQRGREHGIPGYNAFRELVGLTRAATFDDFCDVIPRDKVEKLKQVYKHPNDVDLFVGGLYEVPTPNGIMGRTFSSLLAIQFWRLRHGDRFWYENPFCTTGFSSIQLTEIRKVSLARVICDNTDNIVKLQKHVLSLPSDGNPVVSYLSLPRLDLTKWLEIPGNERKC